jgi:hypothetical protein
MDNAILNLMDSSNPKDRKRAIKALIDDGSQEALKYLAKIYKTDSDPEIRDLAMKAGRYVKKQQIAGSWEGEGLKHVPEPEPKPEEQPDYVPVSTAKQELAKGFLDSAMDASISRDKKRAFDLLRKAFSTNPNLRMDSYAMNIATDITGREKDETLALLGFGDAPVDPADAGLIDEKSKRKRKNEEGAPGEVTWEMALTDLAILYIVVAGVMIVGLVLSLSTIAPALRNFLNELQRPEFSQSGSTTLSAMQIEALFGSLMGAGVIGSIIYGLLYALGLVIGLLIMYAFVHVAATMVLGGDGTFRGLIHHSNNLHLFLYGGGLALTFVALVALLPAILDVNSLRAMGAYQPSSSMSGVVPILWLVSFVFSLVWFIWFSKAIGTNYNFSAWRGCTAIFVSNILMSILSCACSFALSSAISNMLLSNSTTLR